MVQIDSTPNHPTTCGKVDRFHQTLPHRSLAHHATPATAHASRPKAQPGERLDTHHRVRTDRIDETGSLTLRHAGRLHHIGIGRTHARTRILMLIQDLHIRIINAATGELIRQLTIDPTRDYQPAASPAAALTVRPAHLWTSAWSPFDRTSPV